MKSRMNHWLPSNLKYLLKIRNLKNISNQKKRKSAVGSRRSSEKERSTRIMGIPRTIPMIQMVRPTKMKKKKKLNMRQTWPWLRWLTCSLAKRIRSTPAYNRILTYTQLFLRRSWDSRLRSQSLRSNKIKTASSTSWTLWSTTLKWVFNNRWKCATISRKHNKTLFCWLNNLQWESKAQIWKVSSIENPWFQVEKMRKKRKRRKKRMLQTDLNLWRRIRITVQKCWLKTEENKPRRKTVMRKKQFKISIMTHSEWSIMHQSIWTRL